MLHLRGSAETRYRPNDPSYSYMVAAVNAVFIISKGSFGMALLVFI